MNVKVVERLYKEERLALHRRTRKKIPKGVRDGGIVTLSVLTSIDTSV